MNDTTDSVNAAGTTRPIRRIVVLGGGSAGFLVALALKKKVPDIELTVVRSTKMGVIGVGESTIISVVTFLHKYLGLDSQRFHERAVPSIKLGIRFIWGKRPFFNYAFSPQLSAPLEPFAFPRGYYCRDSFDFADMSAALMTADRVCLQRVDGQPRFLSSIAYHLENRTFVRCLEEMADELGIPKIDDVVQHIEQSEAGIEALVLSSGERVEADLFVDCSGFRSELLGRALGEPFVDFR
jgi:tryptophan halogenase